EVAHRFFHSLQRNGVGGILRFPHLYHSFLLVPFLAQLISSCLSLPVDGRLQ
ncbi:hypothetical protein COCVIDRAFT_86429, partial [Bipolaris victoriae FI3]